MTYHNILLLTLTAFLGWSYYVGYTPVALIVFILFASVVAYILYAIDKTAAMEGSWRVSENTLHMAALLFGWPGALIAQNRLRHKTKKKSFRAYFWLMVMLNLAGIAWIHTPPGNNQLRYSAYQLENIAISNIPFAAPVSAILFLTRMRTNEVQWLR